MTTLAAACAVTFWQNYITGVTFFGLFIGFMVFLAWAISHWE